MKKNKQEHVRNFGKRSIGILLLILLIATICRVYLLTTPLGDFFSWRQADTAAVARNFVKNGFDLLHPRYDDFSNIQSGKENPRGYRMVEFPIYNSIFAAIYKTLPIVPLEVYGRTTTIFFSLIIISIIYYFLLKEVGFTAAVIGGVTYAILPFFVFFSRVVLPDTTALAFCFLSLFFLYLFSQKSQKRINILFYILSLIFFALGLLTKPTVIFYSLATLYLFFRKYHINLIKKIPFYLYFLIGSLPFIWWRYHISQFPEGVPASEWLFSSVNTSQGLQTIFFRPAFFRWIFFERINNIILGGFLTFFFMVGIIAKINKYFLHTLLISALIYLFTFQGGNVQHEYYQIMILPVIAIFVGIGTSFIIKNSRLFISPIITYPLILFIFTFSIIFSYFRVKDYYSYSKELVEISKIIKYVTMPDDLIVTDTTGDTTLLYLSDRRGAPAPYKDFEELKKIGYKYFITQNGDVIKSMKESHKFPLVPVDTDKFAMFAL